MDLQNPALVLRLLQLGADVNCLNYGGFAPYHLTYGRQSEEIRRQLYEKTARELRRLPDSESDDSDAEGASEDEVGSPEPLSSLEVSRRVGCFLTCGALSLPQMYDDIKFGE